MYRKQDWDTPLPRQNNRRPKEPERPDEGGWQDWPPSAETPLHPVETRAPDPALPKMLDAPPAAPEASAATPRRRLGRPLAIGAVLAVAAAGGGWFGYGWWTVGRFTVSTDDAYVESYNTTLAAKVPGYVANVLVSDNSPVRAGEVIATIDDGD